MPLIYALTYLGEGVADECCEGNMAGNGSELNLGCLTRPPFCPRSS